VEIYVNLQIKIPCLYKPKKCINCGVLCEPPYENTMSSQSMKMYQLWRSMWTPKLKNLVSTNQINWWIVEIYVNPQMKIPCHHKPKRCINCGDRSEALNRSTMCPRTIKLYQLCPKILVNPHIKISCIHKQRKFINCGDLCEYVNPHIQRPCLDNQKTCINCGDLYEPRN